MGGLIVGKGAYVERGKQGELESRTDDKSDQPGYGKTKNGGKYVGGTAGGVIKASGTLRKVKDYQRPVARGVKR